MRTWTEGNGLARRQCSARLLATLGLDAMEDPAVDRGGSEPAVTPSPHATGLSENLSHRIPVLASRVRAQLLFMVLDAACVVAGYSAAEVFYWRNVAPTAYGWHFELFVLIVIIVTLICNHIYGLYGRMWRHAGLEEARQIILSSGTVAAVLIIIYTTIQLAGYQVVHPEVLGVGLILATLGMGLVRFQSRIFAWQRGSRGSGLRVAVVGSRDAAASAVREMIRHPDAGLIPVAVFDDDTSVHGMSLIGVPVVGSIRDIPAATSRYMLQEVLLAIPNASPEMIADVLHTTEAAGITMKVLPTVQDVVTGRTGMFAIRRAREPRIEDLLGRTPVATDLEGVRSSIESHRVLVTGAGGSIGSEICRQVAGFAPAQLVLLDHDETHLHDTASVLEGPCHQALVDINDRETLFDVFERYRPDVVLHTAAHKHVPVLEDHPVEAARTNVFGTLNVIEASAAVGVTRFLLVSSDKAVRPSSIMGASKRAAEQVLLNRSPQDGVVLRGPVRQCAREPGQRHSDVRPPDQVRRSGHGDRSQDDPVLHERRRSGATRAPGVAVVRGPRHFHARDGRAGPDHRPRPQDDPAVGRPGRRGHLDQGHRYPTG